MGGDNIFALCVFLIFKAPRTRGYWRRWCRAIYLPKGPLRCQIAEETVGARMQKITRPPLKTGTAQCVTAQITDAKSSRDRLDRVVSPVSDCDVSSELCAVNALACARAFLHFCKVSFVIRRWERGQAVTPPGDSEKCFHFYLQCSRSLL